MQVVLFIHHTNQSLKITLGVESNFPQVAQMIIYQIPRRILFLVTDHRITSGNIASNNKITGKKK